MSNPFDRNYQKIKSLEDYKNLDSPGVLFSHDIFHLCPYSEQMILRMLVRPKYGDFKIPEQLSYLSETIRKVAAYDAELTGIKDSWCYVTVRHGPVISKTDDEWHFDGASFRTDIIPERNYIWVSDIPTEYRGGGLNFPSDFDPNKHDLFSFADARADKNIENILPRTWYLINPFCLHRRPKIDESVTRTFFRISFPDIEGRDVMNTENPLLPTPFFGRNPVASFRNKLAKYGE